MALTYSSRNNGVSKKLEIKNFLVSLDYNDKDTTPACKAKLNLDTMAIVCPIAYIQMDHSEENQTLYLLCPKSRVALLCLDRALSGHVIRRGSYSAAETESKDTRRSMCVLDRLVFN